MLKIFQKKNYITSIVEYKNYFIRILFLIVFTFLYALIYNLFLVPNQIVVGGISGLAIVIKELTGLSTSIFMSVTTVVLVVIYFFIFGKKKTINTLIGSVLFTMMVSLTEPLVSLINIDFKNRLLMLLFTGVLYGTCSGMIYRSGFNTGGSDIIACILVKYAKITVGQAGRIINSIIIIIGALVFGLTNAIYAVIILFISSKMVDIVMLGINDSKMCFIKSNNAQKIKDIIPTKLNVGVTEMNTKITIFKKNNPVLLIIVPYHTYPGLKDEIFRIDSDANITSVDCYSVLGGYKKTIIPF